MHHSLDVTKLYNFHNCACDYSSGSLCVMTSGNDAVKKLTAFTKLHHQMHSLIIFVRTF
jgi:hypothetical protein